MHPARTPDEFYASVMAHLHERLFVEVKYEWACPPYALDTSPDAGIDRRITFRRKLKPEERTRWSFSDYQSYELRIHAGRLEGLDLELADPCFFDQLDAWLRKQGFRMKKPKPEPAI